MEGGLRKIFVLIVRFSLELLALPIMVIVAVFSRLLHKTVDIGLGPEPLINNVYYKKALLRYGYTAETFVTSIYFITQEFDRKFIYKIKLIRLLTPFLVFCFIVTRYKCVYLYFNGGAFAGSIFLWYLEPSLLRMADVRMVVMPYGGDIQCMDRCPNLLLRHAMAKDYPMLRFKKENIKNRIDLWTKYADHIIAGNDWVDYLYYWDTLMLNHFSIDTALWNEVPDCSETAVLNTNNPLRVLHAPNHRELKGTRYFIQAVDELKREGLSIELVLIEKLPNDQIRELMMKVDVVADQLIIGWYAMFALEAMALGKPVLCFVREDLKQLYIDTGLIGEDELPVINCSPSTVKDVLRKLVENRQDLHIIGQRGREFVVKHHSLEVIGSTFDKINRSLGITPSGCENIVESNNSKLN